MPLLDERPIHPDFLPESITLRDPAKFVNAARIARIEQAMHAAESLASRVVHLYAAPRWQQLDDSIGDRRAFYHAAGMRLWRIYMETGQVHRIWWVIFRSALAAYAAALSEPPEDHCDYAIPRKSRPPLHELRRRVSKAKTTEQAEEILRSIAPKDVVVLSEV